jgi:hypothetical protein
LQVVRLDVAEEFIFAASAVATLLGALAVTAPRGKKNPSPGRVERCE